MSGQDNIAFTIRVVAASTTLTLNDYVLSVEAPAANVTVTLPAVATVPPGRTYIIKRDATATQTVTLDGAGAETINGAATRAVGAAGTAGAAVIISDGAEWHVIGSY
ncbi:MAG TPA: hypothetical protein VJP77_02075 [Planctomycetota bacterium]|nr:hypothetical protein [Planctomycetota bacterium]